MPHVGRSWVSLWWRALVGEVVSTALLMVLGVGSMFPDGAPLTHPALGFGFTVTALVTAFGPVCGAHMNPAVTLATVIHGHTPLLVAAAYVVAQIVGAIVGFGLLMCVTEIKECGGCTLPGAGVSESGAVLVEAWLTAALVLAAGSLGRQHDPAAPDHSAPVKLGLTVAALVYGGGKLTGASLNPARSLAPALLTGCWRAHWAYWAGPLGGATLAALAQRYLLLPAPPAAPRAPAPRAHTPPPDHLPLNDKHDV